MFHFRGLIGVCLLLLIAFALSSHKRNVKVRIILVGVAMEFVLAFLCLNYPPVVAVIDTVAEGVTKVISFADAGTEFLFGKVADPSGPWGFVFAVRVLPVIIFFASLMSVLYYLKIMQRVVACVAWMLRKGMGITGSEALSAAANIFVGQTEAPLMVKPYIPRMTRSQLMALMACGFASIAGSVLAAYVGILGGGDEASRILFAKHLMTASVMSAPGGLVFAKIMEPEVETPPDEHLGVLLHEEVHHENVVDAAAAGATDGMKLAANVAAMLVAFVALLAMVNWPLAALSELSSVAVWREAHGIPVLTLQNILGYILSPLAWTMGVASKDCLSFGAILGEQVIVTEFVAYLDLGKHIANGTMDHRSCQIASYALCGFANLPSIAIQIGGLSGMAPSRRADFASLGLRAMIAGALSCWMAAAIAGLFIP